MKWSNEVKILSTTYGVFKACDNRTRHSSEYYDLNIKHPVWKKITNSQPPVLEKTDLKGYLFLFLNSLFH